VEPYRLPLTGCVWVLLVVPAFIDVPARVGIGRISGMGLLSIVQVAFLGTVLIACRRYPARVVHRLVPYCAFLGWAAFSVVVSPPTFQGVQNGVVYLLFGLAILFSGTTAASDPRAMESALERGVRWIDGVGLSLALISLGRQALTGEDEGAWLVSARSFALVGLLALSWHCAQWHAGRSGSGMKAWLWITAIGLSLSRTATGVALLYVVIVLALQLRRSPRSLLLRVPAGALAVGISALFIFNTSAMEERLFTGDTSLQIGDVSVNASGRLTMWSLVVESAAQSPIVGHGLGSSQQIVTVLEGVGHPHNDYLRVWNDLGYIGLGLLLAALCSWLACLWRGWRFSQRGGEPREAMELAAFLALLGLLIAAFTDNAMVYPFVMGPLGVFIGAGLGASAYDPPPLGRRRGGVN